MPSDFSDFLPHGVAHEDDHGLDSGPASSSSRALAGLAWWLVRTVPWYLWVMLGIYVYGTRVRGAGRHRDRKAKRPLPASDNAPRRPDAPSRDVIYRGASPLAMPRPSSPNIERRGSYRRYSSSGSTTGTAMDERPRSTSGLRNAYTPSRSSLSSPRPPPSIDSLQQQQEQEPHAYSTSALPRPSTGAGPSALRNAYPSSSAPAIPTVSSQQRKRAHDDADESADAEAGKRSRVDEAGAYDFAHTDDDDDDAMGMDLDDNDEENEARAAPPKRGTKRRDAESDVQREVDSKRTRTAAPDVSVPGSSRALGKASASNKKRRASSGSSAGSSSAAGEPSAGHQQKKKARKAAIGTGSVRDKRAVDDTSFDDEVDEDALELSEDDAARERNADSDVDEADQQPDEEEEEGEPRQSKGKDKVGQVKRFRSRRDRSGSDDDDLMGDVEPVYGSSAAASSTSSPAPSSSRHGGVRNARLGRLLAKQQSRSSTPQRRTAGKHARDTSPSPSPSHEDLELVSPDTPRKPGDEWTNHEGDRYRIDADGAQRRLCEVREKRLKFRMPKDSRHPDARATHVVLVEKWLTADEYEQAFAHRKLAWQTTFEEEARQQRMQQDDDSAGPTPGEGGPDSPAAAGASAEHERAMYFTRGVGTPLRAYRNLDEVLARPGSGSGSATPASPRASPLLANGRMRLASGPGSRSGTPRSTSRKWSEYEVKKLLEGEEAARAERDRRRLGYLAMGGDLYETEQERKEREAKEEKEKKADEPAKIKLADYALAAPTAKEGETKADEPKAAAPAAPSLFAPSAPAPTSAPSTNKTAAPNFFGAPLSATAAPATEIKKPAATPAFSFGAPAAGPDKKDGPAPAEAPKALFGGASAASEKKDAAPKAAFSFGAPATTAPAPAEKKDEPPKAAPFAFGAPSVAKSEPASASSTPAPAPSFSFGAPAAPAKTDEAPKPASFSFGAPPTPAPAPAPETKAEAPKPAFSFGASAAAEKKDEVAAAATAPSPFGAPAATSTSTPSFGGFGAAPSAAPAAPTPSFSFGATTAPKPAEEVSKPAAPSFSFGAAPAAPSAPSFSFGAASAPPAAPSPAAAAAAPSTGFTFGQVPAAAQPASPAVSASTGFSFGASPGPASPAPSAAFSFGASPTAAPGSTPMFSFGSTGGDESASGTTTPRRRPTRRLPTRQG